MILIKNNHSIIKIRSTSMAYSFKDVLGGQFFLHNKEFYLNKIIRESTNSQILSIAWNKGLDQEITVEGIQNKFPCNAILPLMANQSFRFSNQESVILWRFNRE